MQDVKKLPTWRVVEVELHALETALNLLADQGYTVHTLKLDANAATVVAKLQFSSPWLLGPRGTELVPDFLPTPGGFNGF